MVNPKTKGWKAFKQSFTHVLKENTYDIIYCHLNGYRILPYYYYVRKYSDAPFYVHAHSSHYPNAMLSQKKKIQIQIDQIINRKLTDKVVGCGTLPNKDVFGKKINEENMVVIPNSVDVERFVKSKESIEKLRKINREKFHLEDDELVIGHI